MSAQAYRDSLQRQGIDPAIVEAIDNIPRVGGAYIGEVFRWYDNDDRPLDIVITLDGRFNLTTLRMIVEAMDAGKLSGEGQP